MSHPRICSIEGCDKPIKARGWCENHYYRWKRHGDPLICLLDMSNRGKPFPYLHDVVLPHDGQDCLIWPFCRDAEGRGKIQYNGSVQLVSRIVCEAINGPPPSPLHEAAHECGKNHLGCVSPTHLTWKTHIDNVADTLRHGTRNRGERNGQSKLTKAEAKEIKRLKGLISQSQLSAWFSVSKSTIADIHSSKNWNWLT